MRPKSPIYLPKLPKHQLQHDTVSVGEEEAVLDTTEVADILTGDPLI